MALREILTEPNKLLREKSLAVEGVDEDLQKLMDDMLETMYAAPGIGLAAIQVGVPKRVIVLDIRWRDKSESTSDEKQVERKNPMYFVNPEIIGEDNVHDLNPETIYFLNRILNKLSLKKIRNNILSEALPVRI